MKKSKINNQEHIINNGYKLSVIDYRLRGGFTLAELVIAMGVFLIAITLAVGVFVSALKTQRIVNHLMSVNSNASIVIESLSRETRTGYSFSAPQSFSPPLCVSPQFDILTFKNFKGKLVTYELENSALVRQECNGDGTGCGSFLPMTASNVLVNRLCFVRTQATANDPWRITTVLTVSSPDPSLASNALNLETTVSSRILPQDVTP